MNIIFILPIDLNEQIRVTVRADCLEYTVHERASEEIFVCGRLGTY